MGVLNRTPDSFSDGGRFMDDHTAILHVRKMVSEGADIIDVGGESTRPGSGPVDIAEEIRRTVPIIGKICREIDVPVSIDTSKPEVARLALAAGASIVNDITGLKSDPDMAKIISEYKASVCVMHMKGSPATMQVKPSYMDLMGEILEGLRESIEIAERAGISEDKIIVDPGIGFGKTLEHNLTILRRLGEIGDIGKPVLIGVSRKSFIGKVLDKEVSERLMGTAAASALAIMKGACIIRTHDVSEISDVTKMMDAIMREKL